MSRSLQQPLSNVPTKYQLPSIYSFIDMLEQNFKDQGHYGKIKRQIKVTPTYPNQCPYQVSTSYTLWFPRNSSDKIFKLKISTATSNQGHMMMSQLGEKSEIIISRLARRREIIICTMCVRTCVRGSHSFL